MSYCILRAPKSLAKYEKAAELAKQETPQLESFEQSMMGNVLRNPKNYQNQSETQLKTEFEEVNLTFSAPNKVDVPVPKAEKIRETSVSNRSIWASMEAPQDLDRLIENLIKLYENGFIGDWEYQLRKGEIESMLPANFRNQMMLSGGRAEGDDQDQEEEGGGLYRNAENVFIIRDGVLRPKGGGVPVKSSTIDTPGGGNNNQVVRVFLSSTFRDMQAEREQLIKQAFPVIRAKCAARGLIFKEVDLRWGITEEQATRGDILDICLSEIDMCRPYFVNFIGSRYGWVPAEFPKTVISKFPFLANIPPGTKSVTEIEVLHGALNDTNNAKGAFFYLKNERYDQIGGDELELANLKNLRAKIQSSGLPVKSYSSPEEFAKQVSQDLSAAIERDFPESEGRQEENEKAAGKLEDNLHHLHSLHKARIYVGRNTHFDALDNFVSSITSSGPFLVTGLSGVGKSSLLANWFLKRKNDSSMPVYIHHVGSGGEASDCVSMLRRVMTFIKDRYGWMEEVTDDPKKAMRDFGRWLQTGTAGKRLVLILDGIDQISDIDGAHNLAWLPNQLPGHVKVILASPSGHRCTKVLAQRSCPSLVLKGLSRYERETLCVEYLLSYGKSLSSSQLSVLCKEPQTSNPLYLRCVLEELRVFGVFEELDQILDHYLRSRHTHQLLQKILARLEKDYGQEYPGIVRDVFSLIYCSHQGLTEQELLDLLEVPALALSPLLSAARELLTYRYGMLNLFHDALRQAIHSRYLDHEDLICKYHMQLADYFEAQKLPLIPVKQPASISKRLSRKAEELPHHLLKSQQWFRLKNCLSDIVIFDEWFTKRSKFDIKRCWLALGDKYSVSESYLQSLSEYENELSRNGSGGKSVISSLLMEKNMHVAKFLKEMLHYEAAATLLNRCLEISDSLPQQDLIKAKLNYRIAQIYWNQGMWEKAEPYCLESLRIHQQVLGGREEDLAVAKCLCGLGELYVLRDQKKAEVYLNRSMEIRVRFLGQNHHLVSRIMHDLAVIRDHYGDHDEAIRLHKRAIQIREDTLGPENPQLAMSWENLGTTQKLGRKPQEAEESMKKALAINVLVHGTQHPAVASCYEWLSLINQDMGRQVRAAEYHDQSVKILADLAELGVDMVERVAD